MSTSAHSLISDFKKFAGEGRLGQSYLFFGEDGHAMAGLCRAILSMLEPNSGTAPFIDSRELSPDAEGFIGIGAVREAIMFLWQKPLVASRKTLFINGADALTPQAQHALLKTAEEPPEHGLMLFSVFDPRTLLAPLVSRFQKIYVRDEEESHALAGAEKEAAGLAKKFIAGAAPERKSIIVKVLEAEELPATEQLLAHFVRHLLMECRKDPIKHVRLMGRITDRWAKMQDFNTNKKLQLETLLDA